MKKKDDMKEVNKTQPPLKWYELKDGTLVAKRGRKVVGRCSPPTPCKGMSQAEIWAELHKMRESHPAGDFFRDRDVGGDKNLYPKER